MLNAPVLSVFVPILWCATLHIHLIWWGEKNFTERVCPHSKLAELTLIFPCSLIPGKGRKPRLLCVRSALFAGQAQSQREEAKPEEVTPHVPMDEPKLEEEAPAVEKTPEQVVPAEEACHCTVSGCIRLR